MPIEDFEKIPVILTETVFPFKLRGKKEIKPLVGILTTYEESKDEGVVKVGFDVNGPAGRKFLSDMYYLMYLLVGAADIKKNPPLVLGAMFVNMTINNLTLSLTHELSKTNKFASLLRDVVSEKFIDGSLQVETRMGRVRRLWDNPEDPKVKEELDFIRPKGIEGVFKIRISDLDESLKAGHLDEEGKPFETRKDLAAHVATNLLMDAGRRFDKMLKPRER